MGFDDIIDRRGTNCDKWDNMERIYGISADDGLAMWVADMDFRSPPCISRALREMVDHQVYGYRGNYSDYKAAIAWWMKTRHGWEPAHESILTTSGVVNAVGLCVDTYTEPEDGVVIFTPGYHAFGRVIRAAGRWVVECPLVSSDGRYRFDFDAYDALMTGRERMAILCSPHNPGGRVWSLEELRQVADFAARHNLVIVSDEIHQDLTMPGHRHIPMVIAAPEITSRLVILTAPSKTFNTAGAETGQPIIPDADLRKRFTSRLSALSLPPNSFGVRITTAAYSSEGAAWVDELRVYLDGNRRLFDSALNAIPGIRSMELEATYLAWVDFSGTGMDAAEFTGRVEKGARIAANRGTTFGTGGESFLRFNLGAPRSVIADAAERLQSAFADLQ